MTTEKKDSEAGVSESSFVCKYCGETKPFSEMVVVTEYFPALVICSKCSKNVRK